MVKIPVVVFGLGRIGMLYGLDKKRIQPASHIECILNNLNFDLVGVSDLSKNYRQKFLKNYNKSCNVFVSHLDLLQFLKKSKINPKLFVIATPDKTHFKIIKDIVQTFGPIVEKSIIFCEKPLTNDLKSAKKIQKLLIRSNYNLIVNHTRRWSIIWNLCKSEIKKIGNIEYAIFNFSTSPENTSMDQMRDGIHIADLVNWYGIKNKINVNRFYLPYLVYDFHMWGDKGKIEVLNNGQTFSLYKKNKSSRFTGFYELVLERKSKIQDLPLKNAYSEFSDFFKKNNVKLSTNLSDALESIKTFKSHIYLKESDQI
jgi:hypothetical protein